MGRARGLRYPGAGWELGASGAGARFHQQEQGRPQGTPRHPHRRRPPLNEPHAPKDLWPLRQCPTLQGKN